MAAEFKTFEGKNVSYDTIDHQHLSNCYWYNKIVLNRNENNYDVLAVLERRFNGELLHYRPKFSFKYEIEFLYFSKIVFPTSDPDRDVIIVDGFEIGEIIKK